MMRFLSALMGGVLLATGPVLAQDAKKIGEGKKIYDSKECAKCHMIAGKGNKIGPLDGVATKLSEADIRKWLTQPAEMEKTLDHKPKVKMSSKKIVLQPAELDAVVAYLQSLKK